MKALVTPAAGVALAVIALGLAFSEVRQARTAVRERDALIVEVSAARAQELGTATEVVAVQSRIAAISKDAEEVKQRLAVTSGSDFWDRLYRAGQDLLVRHPEARALVADVHRASIERAYGPYLRAVGVTGTEYERIIQAAHNSYSGNAGIGGVAFRFGPEAPEAFDDWAGKLPQLLGAERFARYVALKDSERIKQPLLTLAISAYDSDAALEARQVVALSNAIDRHTTIKEARQNWKSVAVEWPAVAMEAHTFLSEVQLELLSAAIERAGSNPVTLIGRQQ